MSTREADLEDVFVHLTRAAERAMAERSAIRRPHHRLRRRRADRGADAGDAPQGAVLAKGPLTEGSTAWAQGGIAAVLEPGDTFESISATRWSPAPGSTAARRSSS